LAAIWGKVFAHSPSKLTEYFRVARLTPKSNEPNHSYAGVIRSSPDSSEVAAVRHTAWLAERAGTTPWRTTAADYNAAVSERRGEPSALGLVVPETPWDPA